jgi:hypothetical protein
MQAVYREFSPGLLWAQAGMITHGRAAPGRDDHIPPRQAGMVAYGSAALAGMVTHSRAALGRNDHVPPREARVVAYGPGRAGPG